MRKCFTFVSFVCFLQGADEVATVAKRGSAV